MDKPITQFTSIDGIAIAYQVIGDGPIDLVYASGWLHNCDVVWEHEGYRQFLLELSKYFRLIMFDKRGTGMSDRNVGVPTLEERADDIRAVMDAVGSKRASLFGVSEGGNMVTMFAATHPERVRSIILNACFPCRQWKSDWPHGQKLEELEKYLETLASRWGNLGYHLEISAPSVAHDTKERAFFNRLLTQSASPSSAIEITRLNFQMDIRAILPTIDVPALVLQTSGDRTVSMIEAKYLADHIQNARLVVVDKEDHLPWTGDYKQLLEEIIGFASESTPLRNSERILTSILITDIVSSTQLATKIGDAAWRDLIERHDAVAQRIISQNDGKLVKTMGDGLLATFTGPSRAVFAAKELQLEAAKLGLQLRAGVHTGECLRRGLDYSGLAVNIAARLVDEVPGGECWVTSTVRDLVIGSGLSFEPSGSQKFSGVEGTWQVFKVQD